MLVSFVTAVLGMTGLLVVWMIVQFAWRKQCGRPCGDDPLTGRLGCHGCHCGATHADDGSDDLVRHERIPS
jgi:hypothetical protein